MTYVENVERAALAWREAEGQEGVAKTARERSDAARYELARLTHESTYGRGDVGDQPGRVSMRQWCEDLRAAGVDLVPMTLAKYKRAWELYGHTSPYDRPTWRDAWSAAVPGDSPESVAERRRLSEPRNASPETKRAIFRELADDPAITQEMARPGSPVSRAVGELQQRQQILSQEARERAIESDPILKRLDQLDAALDVEQACANFARDLDTMTKRFAREIDKALPRTGPAREQPLFWVRRSIMQARASLDALEGYAESGTTDLDTFLGEVLGGVR